MIRYTEFVSIFSFAYRGLFRISLLILNGICSNEAQITRKINVFLVVMRYSEIWPESRDHSANVLPSIWATGTMPTNSDEPNLRIAFTPPERA